MAHKYPEIYGEDPSFTPRPSGTVVQKRIRFTDDGELVNRCEWTDILEELKKVKKPQIIVVYVHGWKHNAEDPNDTDWRSFDSVLNKLGETEKESPDPRQVVGIYVGWNGNATEVPFFKELSFWPRKRAADQLTQSAALTKFIGAIAHVRELKKQPRDLVVFIGHSFGARILFSATSGLLLYESQFKHPGHPGGAYDVIKSPADLIVLLNPAFEALRYTAFDALRRYKETFSIQQQPLLLTISTDNDWATGVAFPIGQWVGLEMRSRQRTTLGNYTDYFSHELSSETMPASVDPKQVDAFWYDNFCHDGICLRRTVKSQEGGFPPGNPFLVATTNESVLNGHGGIWKDPFPKWLNAFVKEVDQHKGQGAQAVKGH